MAQCQTRCGMQKGTWLLTESFESLDRSPPPSISTLCMLVGGPIDATGYALIPITAATGKAGGTVLGTGGIDAETEAIGNDVSSAGMSRAAKTSRGHVHTVHVMFNTIISPRELARMTHRYIEVMAFLAPIVNSQVAVLAVC